MQYIKDKIGVINTYFIYIFITLCTFVLLLQYIAFIPFNKRQFFEKDPSLSYYDTARDEMPVERLYMVSTIVPIIVLILVFYFNKLKWNNTPLSHFTKTQIFIFLLLTLVYTLLSTECVIQMIKTFVSRPRPDFFYLCNYKGYADAIKNNDFTEYNNNTTANVLGNFDGCFNQHMVKKAVSSFPSNHAGMSFASMIFTTFSLQFLFDITNFFTLFGIISFSPLLISFQISLNRILVEKHHESDIIGGIVIGFSCAFIAWNSFKNIIVQIPDDIEKHNTMLGNRMFRTQHPYQNIN